MATTKKNILYADVAAAGDKLWLDKNTVNMFAKAQKIAVPPYNSGWTPVDTPVVPWDTTPVKPGVDKTAIISNAWASTPDNPVVDKTIKQGALTYDPANPKE